MFIKHWERMKSMQALVSIIIPAYQEEKRIGRCLDSILRSSYRNLELIVVNDGSTDKTGEVVRSFMKKADSNGAVIKLVEIPNGGPAHARNVGLKKTSGQFIGFADADDMIHPQMIERLAESLRRGNDLAVCGQLICKEDGKRAWRQYPLREQHRRCPKEALEMVMWEQLLMSCNSSLFLREKIFDKAGELFISFPEAATSFEDFAFVCEYLLCCNGVLEVLPFPGYFYCKHPGSLTTRTFLAEELYRDLQPILRAGEAIGDEHFTAHKLQYAFRFMAFWYEEAFRCSRQGFSEQSESWKLCMRELERYADIYMKASNVLPHRKLAMWIVRKHPNLGRLFAKTVGRVIL